MDVVKVGRSGNSIKVTIPDAILDSLKITDGMEMQVRIIPYEGTLGIVYTPVTTTNTAEKV